MTSQGGSNNSSIVQIRNSSSRLFMELRCSAAPIAATRRICYVDRCGVSRYTLQRFQRSQARIAETILLFQHYCATCSSQILSSSYAFTGLPRTQPVGCTGFYIHSLVYFITSIHMDSEDPYQRRIFKSHCLTLTNTRSIVKIAEKSIATSIGNFCNVEMRVKTRIKKRNTHG